MSVQSISLAAAPVLVDDEAAAASSTPQRSRSSASDFLQAAAPRTSGGLDAFVARVFPGAGLSAQARAQAQWSAQVMANPLASGRAALGQGQEAMRQWVRMQLGTEGAATLSFEVGSMEARWGTAASAGVQSNHWGKAAGAAFNGKGAAEPAMQGRTWGKAAGAASHGNDASEPANALVRGRLRQKPVAAAPEAPGGGFSRALVGRWNALIDGTMQQMSPQERREYAVILNDEMRKAMQVAMLHDAAVGEYEEVTTRSFSASGHGTERSHSLHAATRRDQGIDTASIQAYQGAKFAAATDYAKQFDESARGGIVAMAMGGDYARSWVLSNLGVGRDGMTLEPMNDDKKSPYTRALKEQWNEVKAALREMPKDMRQEYQSLANGVCRAVIQQTMIMDAKAGRFGTVKMRDFSATKASGKEYLYYLKESGELGWQRVKKRSFLEKALPIAATIMCFVPGLQGVGLALNGALAVKSGIETGNWTGAVIAGAAGAVGLGAAMAPAAGAAAGAGTAAGAAASVSTMSKVAQALTSPTLRAISTAGQLYGGGTSLYHGIKNHDWLTAVSGAVGLGSGLAGVGTADGKTPWLAGVGERTSILSEGVQKSLSLTSAGVSVYRGAKAHDSLAIAAGLTGGLVAGAQLGGMNTKSDTFQKLSMLDLGADFAVSARNYDGLGMSVAGSHLLGSWHANQVAQDSNWLQTFESVDQRLGVPAKEGDHQDLKDNIRRHYDARTDYFAAASALNSLNSLANNPLLRYTSQKIDPSPSMIR